MDIQKINTSEFEDKFKDIFDKNWNSLQREELLSMTEKTQQAQVNYITNTLRKPVLNKKLWPKIVVAAAVAVVFFSAGLFYYAMYIKPNGQITAHTRDVAPGKNGATLTLANGKKIKLSEMHVGALAHESGVTIAKSANGELIYEKNDLAKIKDETNVLSTGRGETYHVRLPDGSIVYLNAESRLTYSVSLGMGSKRIVKLIGEGYFEITKDKMHPFIVETGEQKVEVLGTHFNINAYGNEAEIRTTLLEGSVKVKAGDSTTLRPGEQAVFASKKIRVLNVDVEDAVAWKNGYFMFNSEPLESIMNKLARWYNIKFTFENDTLKSKTFFGTIGRFEQLSKVLEVLGRTNAAEFTIEGKTVIIKQTY